MMKKLHIIYLLSILIPLTSLSQIPQAFDYQAVVRNASGEIVPNQIVGVRISIHDQTPGGTVVYEETYTEGTNNLGILTLAIGTGNVVSGTFSGINWRTNSKYLEVEIDPTGGTSYLSMGTSKLLSVAYAQFSGGSLDWIQSGNDLFSAPTGNIGIGTTTPSAPLHVNDRIRVGEDPNYSTVYGELVHEGGSAGFKINANAGGGSWADLLFQTNGSTKMMIESSGKVGIGTTDPTQRFVSYGSGSENAILGYSPDGLGVWAYSGSHYGLYAHSDTYYSAYFAGSVIISGSLSKGSGSFLIDHPLDPENKLLRHNFVESPENLLIYRGKVALDEKGEATVEMPDYYVALTKEDEASIHITPVGRPFLTGAAWNSDFSAIQIYGDKNREVFWEVLAERDDPVIHELGRPVVEEKGSKDSVCEKGQLLYPEAYGYPKTKGLSYQIAHKGEKISEK